VVTLDTATVVDKAGLLEALLKALQAPPHAGRNLDSLWDVLRDLDRPTLLVWEAWGVLARSDRRTFDAVTGLLAERAARGGLAVLLCGEGPRVELPSLG
jgi:RNAse (barnase) inhibitor barstar